MDAGDKDDHRAQRVATGTSIGLSIGVALSLLLDNWAMLGVGVALGIVLAAGLGAQGRNDDGSDGA